MADSQITGIISGQPATFAGYEALMRERPRKFSGEEAGFSDPGTLPPFGLARVLKCHMCRHWYTNSAIPRAVCEIMRLPDEANVPADGACRFWTVNGADYPLLRVL